MKQETFLNGNLFSGQNPLKQLCVVCACCYLQNDDRYDNNGNDDDDNDGDHNYVYVLHRRFDLRP